MAGMQETHFRKNLAIIGGLLMQAYSGPGKWALGDKSCTVELVGMVLSERAAMNDGQRERKKAMNAAERHTGASCTVPLPIEKSTTLSASSGLTGVVVPQNARTRRRRRRHWRQVRWCNFFLEWPFLR